MTGTVLTEELGDGVRKLSLNRPRRLNAIVPELLDDLVEALQAADRDPAVRAIVLTGEGRAFCSGDDLKDFEAQVTDEAGTTAYVERIQDVTRAMVLGDTPVVGAIRGWAVGGGLEWVINCDFALAAEGTRFFFPEVSWGLFVTGGVTDLLPRLVGLQRARDMILFGERFDAHQAQSWGLIREVVADAALLPAATDLAKRIAALPPGPVRDLRRILARPAGAGLEAAMAAETAATVRGFLDPATAERIAGFG
ncbi:Enoyl-CoA hydratase/carnithine racemase [Tistlia consotensis]|uniref:Enoyl-CoA hydratase/carnithine racemase n=1 Tax=Tistlia consotensis USBA 355 TaxID=560819 RepID=A0A1Y6CCR0_9PROT|nr:enoyl-CoA hydratase/isomerase family protein [Tistlia consotensis]SMF57115.1 Enoyl-CoA hydratase/carnithine racemase [Tistlia consotensis USBA 355]SNR45387.1 Enoyl-CoA hydratase/carnithine racemase [Tistlia consotensis]